MAFHLVVDLAGKAQTAVVHRQQKALDLQLRIQLALDDLDGVQQLADALEREILALHGDDHGVGGRQRVDGDQSERRTAVYQDVIVVIPDRGEQVAHHLLTAVDLQHLDLGADEVDVARHDVQPLDVGCVDSIFYVGMVNDTFVKRTVHLLDVHPQAAGCVGLRIGVNHQHGLLERRQRSRQVDGGGRLSDAALLVGECDNLSHFSI